MYLKIQLAFKNEIISVSSNSFFNFDFRIEFKNEFEDKNEKCAADPEKRFPVKSTLKRF